MALTRLSIDGYGTRLTGSFSGKALTASGLHPVGLITRLSLDGYGARRQRQRQTDVLTPTLKYIYQIDSDTRLYPVSPYDRTISVSSDPRTVMARDSTRAFSISDSRSTRVTL